MRSFSILLAALFTTLLLASGCQVTTKSAVTADIGKPVTKQEMLAALELDGVITFQKHTVAHWEVPLSGLLNLDHPKAMAAGLEDRQEAIEIYTYSLVHPSQGTFLIDSGISEAFRSTEKHPDISALVNAAMNMDKIQVATTTKDISTQLSGIDGVFLTHIHMDHIMGLADLGKTVPVYLGPGDASLEDIMHVFTQGTTDRLLRNQTNLLELDFSKGAYLDVFGDGSLFAIHAPGHTPGTTVYIANTINGVQMMLGDVTHTAWGWEHQVESGTYSHEPAQSAVALIEIKRIAVAVNELTVHPGHQSFAAEQTRTLPQ